MSPSRPTWQATVVAVAITTAVVAMFVIVFLGAGIDNALKAYSAFGSLVGLITGTVATYFFTRDTVENERSHRNRAEAQLHVMMGVADEHTMDKARELRPDLFGPL